MRIKKDFPRRVGEVKPFWIPLADGTRLAAGVWLPDDAEDDPVPAILEYIPYRRADWTWARDEPIHRYFAGHGYASVRVDLRGSGDSDGLLLDEYLQQEQDDAVEVLRWIGEQPWCTGRVGMFGISWGGFNGLQVAARRPPELGAVITLMSTDDRYSDDVHYVGGSVLAVDMLPWSSLMYVWNGTPPDLVNRAGRLARDVAPAASRDAALRRGVALAPAARRVLAARVGVRGLLGDRMPRLRHRRLGRRLHGRGVPAARGAAG